MHGSHPDINYVDHVWGDGAAVFQRVCGLGLEGIVSKRKGSSYRSGRSLDWRKSKNPASPAVRWEADEEWNGMTTTIEKIITDDDAFSRLLAAGACQAVRKANRTITGHIAQSTKTFQYWEEVPISRAEYVAAVGEDLPV